MASCYSSNEAQSFGIDQVPHYLNILSHSLLLARVNLCFHKSCHTASSILTQHRNSCIGLTNLDSSSSTMAELSKPLEPMMAYALGRAFPDWMAALSEATAKTVAARVHGPTVVDFVLTTNWVLLPGGVQDFYEVLYQQPQVCFPKSYSPNVTF